METQSSSAHSAQLADPADVPRTRLEALQLGISQVPPSADAAEVFAAIAQVVVPLVCDACTVRLEYERRASVLIEHSLGTAPTVACSVIPIESLGSVDGYRGSLTLRSHKPQPDAAGPLVGQLLVEWGMSIVERERLRSRTMNLELAVASNREIGAALGILMMTHKCTSEQAFDRLRRASQYSHRKLVVVARDVVTTGLLEVPAPLPEQEPDRDSAVR